MAKRTVEVYECDRCGREPANTWIITGPGGSPRQTDLCDQHGAAISNAYALARVIPKKVRRPQRPEPVAVETPRAPVVEPIWR